MTSDDIKIRVDGNLDVVEPSADEVGVESTAAIDSDSEEKSWGIYKVPHRLREVKRKAYEPNVISIGPYHYGKKHLTPMEVIKRKCFDKMVEENKHLTKYKFVELMKTLHKRVRKCYEGPFHRDLNNEEKFNEMMIFDGCFIVQLIRGIFEGSYFVKLGRCDQNDMWYDLILLENQIPFFVLLKLDSMIMRNGGDPYGFARSALTFFQIEEAGLHIWSGSGTYPSLPTDIKHLLDLLHNCCRPSDFEQKKKSSSTSSRKFIRCATDLKGSGIDFIGEKEKNLFDIKFEKDTRTKIKRLDIMNKALKIPALRVDDQTERMLRNFMAYEQFTQDGEPTYVSDYVIFMDNLINSAMDVELLSDGEVIDNWLGDDKAVANMFNKLGDSICSSADFYYAEIYRKVNKHYNRRWNKHMAILSKDYFSSPWSCCSFLAAIVLLVATLLQTSFTLIPYYLPRN